MILAEVEIDYQDGQREYGMDCWLLENVGPRALFADNVGDVFKWYKDYMVLKTIYRFAREQDAIMFKLKWA